MGWMAPTGPVWGVPRVRAKEPRVGGREAGGITPGVGVTQTPALVLMVPTWWCSLYPVNLNFGVETCIDSSFTLVVRIFYKGEIIYFISECPIPPNAFT